MRVQLRSIAMMGLALLLTVVLLGGCAQPNAEPVKKQMKIGIMLSDVGLGDQSFSDAAFRGLLKARDEEGIVFEYRELAQTKTYDAGFEELIQANSDLIVGLGFMVKESLEKIAKLYPEKQFLIIDEISELPNVASITFKEEEGSFLAGAAAALVTKTNRIGFIGGVDVPLIHKFQKGFEQGVLAVNPKIKLTVTYAGDFGKADLGAKIASDMITKNKVDVIYAAAGFTGVGALQESAERGTLAVGVDTDQFFIAEKAVFTSMLKNVDVAIHSAVKDFVSNQGQFGKKQMVFGLKDNGVGLAPIRVITLEPEKQQVLDDVMQKLASGSITITTP
ncbi:BMP family lipoprotein [Paenibacillus turpanensis]|uniref:BMP family lipoprotein n=1 Tax=Paenibacillus turpanensis TaxID=2689078 RepID=UPI001FB707CE|nr:BMP family ABC transporter substrate-binding protein [Paenibacillus turpanensis]